MGKVTALLLLGVGSSALGATERQLSDAGGDECGLDHLNLRLVGAATGQMLRGSRSDRSMSSHRRSPSGICAKDPMTASRPVWKQVRELGTPAVLEQPPR